MRLLQVPTGSGEAIDLHPAVSVVTGLTAEQRQVLIDVVAGLPAGEARGAGLVEAHDVLFDLDDDVLALFELGDQQVDPVVGPGAHLGGADGQPAPGASAPEPGGDGSTTGSEAIDAARAEVDEARSALAAAAAALDAATTAHDEAAATVSACTAAAAAAAGPHEDEGVRHEAAPGGPTADLEAARQRLEAVEAAALAARDEASAVGEADATEDIPGLRSRRDDLETRRTELTGLLTVLDDDPTDEVVALLAELDGAHDAPADPDPRALALADEIIALVSALDELPAAEPRSPSLEDARQRLDRARAALEVAEAARHEPPPEDAALAVEQAHDELLAALDEAERRFRRARAQQRVEEARAAEQAALAELGLNSYTDFLTGGSRSARSDAAGGADEARAELVAAEEAVVRAEVASRAEQRRTEIREQLADALDRAAAFVGGPLRDEPLRVARALRTVVAEPPDRRDDLVGALSRAGVALTAASGDGTDAVSAAEDPRPDLDLDLDLADLEVLARALVDEAQTNAVRRQAVLTELAEVESELAAVEERLAGSVANGAGPSTVEPPPDPAGEAADDHEVRSAREAVQAAEAAVAEQARARAAAQERLEAAESAELAAAERQAEARAALDEAEAALAAAEARLADAAGDAPAASTAADSAPAEVVASAPVGADDDQAADGPASLEWFVLSRMAAQQAVSYVGGLPLVLDRTLDSLDPVAVSDVLGRLEPTASAVQLIVLTECEGAVRWAEEVGPGRAAVVRPGPAAV